MPTAASTAPASFSQNAVERFAAGDLVIFPTASRALLGCRSAGAAWAVRFSVRRGGGAACFFFPSLANSLKNSSSNARGDSPTANKNTINAQESQSLSFFCCAATAHSPFFFSLRF